ncbi:MAG: DUF971 domain-containing protein [Pseudomonadota bacterium]
MDNVQALSLDNHLARGVLRIVWNDGTEQELDNVFLRGQCQCSICKSEKLRSGLPLTIAPEVRLTEMRPVGLYGVQLIFSDGHERGIFPWAYLRGLS